MVKFFRHIRKSLLEQNKMGKYLKYAIGEILLVVIGILIALQINNWNENQKIRSLEKDILLEIKENLKFNIAKAKEEIKIEKEVIKSIDFLAINFFKKKEYNSSFHVHFNNCFYWPTASWRLSGYETLKSQGVELIQSKKIRGSIIDLYEIKYDELSEIIRTTEGYSTASSTLVLTNFEYQLGYSNKKIPINLGAAIPIDPNELQNNKDYYGFMTFWRVLRIEGIRIRTDTIKNSQELIHQIDEYLKKKSND